MRIALLLARMVRYRVALMIWLFFLLGGAYAWPVAELALGVAVLACLYAAATTVNDLADEDVDRINHPRDAGRPLVSGDATRRELWVVHALASAAAVALALPLGRTPLLLAAASLAVAWAYSLPPVRLSYRTWLCPVALALAYVAIPFALGGGRDVVLAAALGSLFLARIVLKDFRDRDGDAAYGKPTALLRFGAGPVCAASLCALAAGDGLLLAALRPPLEVALLLQAFVAVAVVMLARLRAAATRHDEQVAIGIGAKAGNGLLVCVLAWLATGDPLVVATVAGAFALALGALLADPRRATIAYKG